MPARSPFVPFDFEQRRQQDQSIGTVHTFDPVSDVVGTMRQAEQRDSFLSGEMAPAESLRYFRSQLFGRDPEKTARATVLSRRVGEPPVMVEGREDTFDRYLRASAFQRSVATNPELSRFFGNNPRYAVAASDDAKSVGLVGQGFADIERPKPSLWSWLNGMGVGFVGGGKQMWQGYQLYRQDNPFATPGALGLGNNPGALLPFLAPDEYRRMVRETEPGRRAIIDRYTATQSEIEAATPDFDTSTFLGKTLMGLYQGTSSLAQMAPGMAASIALRSPYPALGAAALQSGLPAYAKYRARGATVAEAQAGSSIEGGAEVLGELFPALLVARKFGKAGAGSFLTEFLVKDMLGEQATTLVQDAADTAIANPNKTWGDYLAERPDAAYQTALGVLVMSGTMGGANHVVRKFVEAGEARANAANIDRLGRAAEASELRRRDPEAYNELIRHMAEKSGTPHVFIPADAVREYMQSDSYDAYNDPFEVYRDQVDEAYETGGDVVLPAEFALGTLPGTPAWAAVKADIRLASGGVSEREADVYDENMDAVEAELEKLAKEGSPDKTEELTQRLQEKLQDAGFTPYVARQQATLMVNRIVTRAARLGNDVTGAEGDYLDIRQVLPSELAKARAADTLDLVINALRKGGEATKQSGQSLLEFIAARGGIEDRGGDIASMGGDKWHRAAPFRKKLLKKFDAAQGSMIGGEYNPNSIGSMFDAAVSAGYFPDLLVQREEGSGYSDALDANAFIDAIGEELAGNPRYAEEAQTDHFRAAADELRQALSERGLDPEGLSDDELRAIVAQMGEAQDGAGFDQLPDTIEIDGAQRPTRNSEGQQIAGTEEGVRAFWKWFGDSKVVDDQGRPLVVYHGGRKGLEVFDPAKAGEVQVSDWGKGVYFTPRQWQAQGYANDAQIASDEREKELYQAITDTAAKYGVSDPMMAGIKLGIGSPEYADVERATKEWRDYRAQVREQGGGEVYPAYLKIENPEVYQYVGITDPYLAGQAKANDRDGVIIVNEEVTGPLSDHMDEILVFDPTQIKSINNRGTFDPGDARILYQRTGIDLSAGGGLKSISIGDATVEYGVSSNGETAEVILVSVPKAKRRGGAARKAMQEFLAATDAAGLTVFLTAHPMGKGGASKTALEKFYKSLGFVENKGRNKDFRAMQGMVRQPPRILYQSAGDGPRGRIQFIPDGRSIIELFKDRNLSTLLHELGHDYLEQLRVDAPQSEQLTSDLQAVYDWFKANGHEVTDGVIPVEAHELWARGFERYLMEGKAPSQGLQRIFETFRGWLTAIYKKVAALRSPITPEIREVMDRLLATDEEIAAMRDQQMLEPLFKDAASIGMTDSEFRAYTDDIARSRHAASGALLEKTMAAIRARETKRYKEARAEVEREVADQVDNVPLFRAMRHMKAGKVDAVWLEREMGKDAKSLLPKGTVKEGGLHPDAIAEISGFDSGKQMIEAVMGAEAQHRQLREEGDKRSMRDRAIQTATDTEMNRRYGDPLSDGSIEREALAAVHSEKQGEVFAAEARALARKTGQRPTPYRMARDWARRKVRQGTYQTEASAGAIQRHQRNVAKAGREAEKAMLAGKFEDALRFKQQQMVSSALLAEAKLANDEVEAARKRLDKTARKATSKTIDQAYLDQAHALLEQVDLRPRSQKSIDRQGKWEAWAAEREAEGFDIVVPASFEATLGQQNWSRLPVETLLALDDAVTQIVHLGRMKQRLLDGKEARDFDALVKEARDGAANINGKPPKGLDEPNFWDAIRSGAAGIDASLLKMETVFDWLDGGNPNGVFNRVVFRPIAEAQGREADMTKDYLGQIKTLFEALPGETVQRWTDKVQTPFTDPFNGRPYTPTRQRLIAMALNIGNEGNMQRLADGYGWNAGAIENFLTSELTAEEWQFVQGVWDTIETLWPEIEAMERRVNGVPPDKVEPREIVTPHGTFRGGYYPAIYDSTLSYAADKRQSSPEGALYEPGAVRATTRSSATKARADAVSEPILLDLGVINRHMSEVIHDLTHREAVMQAWRFLTSERIMKLVDEALGQEIRKQLRPWLKFVANSWAMERAGNEGFGKWLGKLRANTTAVGMGLRATTMVTQIAGYANSTEVVGEKWMAEAIARSSASPIDTYRFVMERSGEVRHRMDTLDRDIRTELARLSASNPVSRAARQALDAKRFFFHGIGYMDRMVSIPTWLAGYNKGLAEGMTEEEAAYAGDKAVRLSQGAGAPKDLAAIQRGTGKWGEALKLFTMFYSYFSAQYQRERTLVRDAMGADKRRSRSVPRLAARAFWLLVVPPLMVELLKMGLGGGNPPDDEEWWSQWIARKLLSNAIGPIPLARDIFEPAWNAARGAQVYNPEFSPVNRFGTSIVNALKDAGKIARGEETKHATKDMLEAAGYATGLVPGQLASASQFLVDVGNGDADPRTFGDWMEGLTTGKLKE